MTTNPHLVLTSNVRYVAPKQEGSIYPNRGLLCSAPANGKDFCMELHFKRLSFSLRCDGSRRASCSKRPDIRRQAILADSQDMSETLSLQNIRSSLIRQEDTIIFSLIERAQFARNSAVYTPSDSLPVPGFDRTGRRYSLLEYALRETEHVHGKLRRYTSPDEHAFYPESLPAMVLPPISYAPVLAHNEINLNASILRVYVKEVLPGITSSGDDNNYGSSAMLDVAVLQALSKRIHYGKFVAEAKFREKTYEYTQLIKSRDADGIMELLTDEAVEERVIARVALKAATFGQDIGSTLMSSGGGSSGTNIFDTNHTSGLAANADSKSLKPALLKIQPDVVASVYKDWVMPLTKEVEVLYLLGRLQHTSPPL